MLKGVSNRDGIPEVAQMSPVVGKEHGCCILVRSVLFLASWIEKVWRTRTVATPHMCACGSVLFLLVVMVLMVLMASTPPSSPFPFFLLSSSYFLLLHHFFFFPDPGFL